MIPYIGQAPELRHRNSPAERAAVRFPRAFKVGAFEIVIDRAGEAFAWCVRGELGEPASEGLETNPALAESAARKAAIAQILRPQAG